MKKAFLKFTETPQRILRLFYGAKRREHAVWNDLKAYHANGVWEYGCYEKDKNISVYLDVAELEPVRFWYMIGNDVFECRSIVVGEFAEEDATKLFVLAAHFNNNLEYGMVVVSPTYHQVEYQMPFDLRLPLLYKKEIEQKMWWHYHVTKNIYWAFQKLLQEKISIATILDQLAIRIYNMDNGIEEQ